MTRFAWLAAALMALPVGCTLLANNALPEDEGGSGGTDPTTSSGGGTTSGMAGGGDGGTGMGEGGEGGRDCAATEDNCFDGIDNDCADGADCADPTCSATAQCIENLDGASYVLDGVGSCPDNFDEVVIATCEACSCDADTFGTCQYETRLFDNGTCTGTPLSTTVVGDGCVEVNAASATGNVFGKARAVIAAPPTCMPASGPAQPPSTRTICQATGASDCDDGGSCVPTHPSATRCLLYDEDLLNCPAERPNRELVFVGGTGDCPCQQCGPSTQDCNGINHSHMYNMPMCMEPPNYTTIDEPDGCTDTGHPLIQSLDNHETTTMMAASGATCESESPPSGGVAKTLCCE